MTRFCWQPKMLSNTVTVILALALVLPTIPADAGCMDACCCQATIHHGASASVQLTGTKCCDTAGVRPCAMNTAQPLDVLDHPLILTAKRSAAPDGSKPPAMAQVKFPNPSHHGLRDDAVKLDTRTIPIYLHTATLLC